MTSSTRRRVASNTAVQLAGKAAVLALGAVSIAVLTRYLGPDDYGRYTLALMYMQLFAVLADVGPLHHGRARHQQGPLAHRRAGGQRARAAAAAVAGGDRARRAPISLLLPYERDVRVAIALAGVPLLFGMLSQLLPGRPAVPAAHGTGGGWRRGGPRRALGLAPARGRSRPRLLRRDGGGRGRSAGHARRHLAAHAPAGCGALSLRAGGLAPAAHYRPPAGARAGDQRPLLPRRHADHLALRALSARSACTRWPTGSWSWRWWWALSSSTPPSPCYRRRWAATSRARCGRSRLSVDLLVILGVPAGGRRAGAGARGHRAGGRARTSPDAAEPLRILLAAGALGLGQRGVRLRAHRQGPPAQRAVAERLGSRVQRRAQPAPDPASTGSSPPP